jgi:ApaG protein
MITKTTAGISISVKPKFVEKLSYLVEKSFVFEYKIIIENTNFDSVKLLTREWYIFDSLDEPYEIEGLGVIGEQPVLNTNQKHIYSSYCELKSEIGYMQGYYNFINLSTNKKFKVAIPRFMLIYPGKYN